MARSPKADMVRRWLLIGPPVVATVLFSSRAQAVVVKVPSQQSTIQSALGVSGVTLVQVDGAYTNYGTVTLVNGVKVERDPAGNSQTPVINANGANDGVVFPVVTTTGTSISGFRITNFANTGISLPSSGTVVATVEKCSIEGGVQGIFAYQACEIADCVLTGQTASAIMCQGTNHSLSFIHDNLITPSGSTSYGIRHENTSSRGALIKNNTVGGANWGIWINGPSGGPATPVQNNVVVDCPGFGIGSVAIAAVAPLYNISYQNGSLNGFFERIERRFLKRLDLGRGDRNLLLPRVRSPQPEVFRDLAA